MIPSWFAPLAGNSTLIAASGTLPYSENLMNQGRERHGNAIPVMRSASRKDGLTEKYSEANLYAWLRTREQKVRDIRV